MGQYDVVSSSRDAPPAWDFAFQGRHQKIAEAAYFKAEQRGFAPGHALDDWLAAEREIDAVARPLPSY
jgi:hypothetical protein